MFCLYPCAVTSNLCVELQGIFICISTCSCQTQEAVTPGREHEGDKTWLMARRVVAKWGDKPEISAPDAPTRR